MAQQSNGILLIDKPAGMTSAGVVAFVKKNCKAGKVGHAGTLDPFATGLLICMVNQATKLAAFFLHGKKTYEAVLHLGVETDTQDSTGVVTSACDRVTFSEKTIRSALKQFQGPIDQQPPAYSALKHQGVPLYRLARRGEPVQKPARRITIYSIDGVLIDLPLVRFTIECSAGTYIRALCSDVGKTLGCGGHLRELRRTQSSGFKIGDSLTLTEIEVLSRSGKLSDRFITLCRAVQDMPALTADAVLQERIFRGDVINDSSFSSAPPATPDGFIKILGGHGKLIAVLARSDHDNRFRRCCVFHH